MSLTQGLVFTCVTLLLVITVVLRLLMMKYKEVKTLRIQYEKNLKTQRAVLGGKFAENLAPFFPDFPFDPTECHFVGSPIDFIVFEGAKDKEVSKIVFLEVKSGKARKSEVQKSIFDAIANGRVSWREYRVPENVTGKVVHDA